MGLDREMFARLYPALRRFAAAVRPPGVEADDLVQEALARALEATDVVALAAPEAYLRTTILHLVSNQRRSEYRRARAFERWTSPGVADDPSYPSDVDALRALPAEDRVVLYLAYVEGRPHREIAEFLGLTEAATRARASRAARQLRASIQGDADA